ncbi:MAG TPA: hypothetical protein VJQ52_21780 [Steroidobacteraceae bacterium]|nr:hypothetical protein [Steroidobacteraceae bacterium]
MKKWHIVFAATMLLTLGTAVAAGSLMHSDGRSGAAISGDTVTLSSVPKDAVAMWKATALSNEYVAPKAPI